MNPESNNIAQKLAGNLTDVRLSAKQRSAIDLLLQGLSDREVAEKINVRRETINLWRNHNQTFITEFEKARQELFGAKTEEINARIEEVKTTKLLSLEGIKARLQLKDQLILQDLSSYNENRARLIQRLEADIEQANKYLDTLNKDDSINAQVNLYINEYKQGLLSTLQNSLNEIVSQKVKDEILTRLGEEITIIEGKE